MGIGVQKDQLWSKIQGALKEKLGAQNFEIWIRPIQMAAISNDSVSLEVPNRYYRDWVAANYGPALNQELEEAIGRPVRLQFHVARPLDSIKNEPEEAIDSIPEIEPIAGVSADKTFENFVVGRTHVIFQTAYL